MGGGAPRIAIVDHRSAPKPARRRAAGCRNAVLVGVVVFVLGQVSLNVAVRNEWVPVRDPVFVEKFGLLEPHESFFSPPAPVSDSPPTRVMALGSSRTQLAFDAARFAEHAGPHVEAFNYGCPAAGPITSALYLRRLLEKGVRPDLVFIEIHPGFITPRSPPFEAQWLHVYRLRPDEVDIVRGFGWDIPSSPHHGPRGYLTAAHSYRFSLLNRYWPTMLPCPFGLTIGVRSDDCGYVKGLDVKPMHKRSVMRRSFEQYAPVLADYHVGGPGCVALRDTLDQCRKHGIRAALVLMPESSDFRVWYGAGYPTIAEFANRLGSECAVPLYDAREWVPDDGFSDGHHLTELGATIFTEKLAEACRKTSEEPRH
jgi:hypothetical protein